MNIFETLLYALAFTVFYFVIGKAFHRVDEILENKLSKKVYNTIIGTVFILVFVIAVYAVCFK